MIYPLQRVIGFIDKTLVIAELELRKIRHDPTELLTRAIQPALWLLVFGQVLGRTRAIPTGGLPYLDFMAPGILAQSVLFIAIFHGIAIIWERDLGLVHKLLASPSPRTALVLGKGISAGVRALSQVVIVYVLALLLGVKINWNPLALAGVLQYRNPGGVVFFYPLPDHCLRGQDPGTLHGHWPGIDDALVLCEQRDLPDLPHAGLAQGDLSPQSVDVRSGRAAGFDAGWGNERFRPGAGYGYIAHGHGASGHHWRVDVSQDRDLNRDIGRIL